MANTLLTLIYSEYELSKDEFEDICKVLLQKLRVYTANKNLFKTIYFLIIRHYENTFQNPI